jgi:integrase
MSRRNSGTIEKRRGIFYARITVRVDGKATRPWIPLKATTADAARAELDALIAERSKPSSHTGNATFRAYASDWLAERQARGVAMADSEKSWLTVHVFPFVARGEARAFGDLLLSEITPKAIRPLLEAVKAKGRSNQTVAHVRATIGRVLDQAWRDEIIADNPVVRVKAPRVPNEVRKPRAILTDAEIAQYIASEECDEELQLMSLVARCEGGMRTRDVNAWTWEMIDRGSFLRCWIPRTKKGIPQELEIPAVLRHRLRERWEACGRPSSGPIFPVRRGPRRGEAKKTRGVSYAKALRRDLARAGLQRRELFEETPVSLPVDFHSFRRAFGTALAENNVNEQRARHLGGWDSSAYSRYAMRTEAMKLIPDGALPRLELPTSGNKVAFEKALRAGQHLGWEADALPTELVPRSCFQAPGIYNGSDDSSTNRPGLLALGSAVGAQSSLWDALDWFLLRGEVGP